MEFAADLYTEKENVFENYELKSVAPLDFYRDVFPVGSFEKAGHKEDKKPNGILCSIKGVRGRHTLVFDELKEIKQHLNDDFVIISPIAYFGRSRTAYNASMLYGICFDLDNVGYEQASSLMIWFDNSANFPLPTYVANSGMGLHLYYLFKRPIPLYRSIHKKLNDLKYDLTRLVWNRYSSQISTDNRQYQGIFQGFRMVGSKTKTSNRRVKVYKVGNKVDIDYLNQFVAPEYRVENLEYESTLSLDEAKEKYPKWYKRRIENGCSRGRWNIKRDLYDWWLRKIKTDNDLKVGHRYFCICALAAYAVKCNIAEDELRKDAYSLLDYMNSLQNDFTQDDIEAALNFYQESYITFPRDEIKKISGLDMPVNRRNGRKQDVHLELARFARDLNYKNKGDWRAGNGRPKNSGTKKQLVLDYAKEHPTSNHSQIARELNISRPTVIKWLKTSV